MTQRILDRKKSFAWTVSTGSCFRTTLCLDCVKVALFCLAWTVLSWQFFAYFLTQFFLDGFNAARPLPALDSSGDKLGVPDGALVKARLDAPERLSILKSFKASSLPFNH